MTTVGDNPVLRKPAEGAIIPKVNPQSLPKVTITDSIPIDHLIGVIKAQQAAKQSINENDLHHTLSKQGFASKGDTSMTAPIFAPDNSHLNGGFKPQNGLPATPRPSGLKK